MERGVQPPDHCFPVSPVDRHGRRISPPVLEAAGKVARRAIEHADKLHVDPATAANLLEEAAVAVSRVTERKGALTQQPVQNLQSYLFRAFIRLVDKTVKLQLLEENAVRMLSVTSRNSTDPLAEVELKILVDELLARGDPVVRDMFYRRTQCFSWEEIGHCYGISSHDAESRFSQALHKIKRRLGLKSDS
jgi:DNA-directed RNA polymerase specialized sigma24 family protein